MYFMNDTWIDPPLGDNLYTCVSSIVEDDNRLYKFHGKCIMSTLIAGALGNYNYLGTGGVN